MKQIDFKKHKKFIIERVLIYGLMSDWRYIVNVYGLSPIKETALRIKSLDPRTLSYLSILFDTPKTAFECYKRNQLTPNYWNY